MFTCHNTRYTFKAFPTFVLEELDEDTCKVSSQLHENFIINDM